MKRWLLRHKALLAFVSVLAVAGSFTLASKQYAHAEKFHTPEELARLHDLLATLPVDTNTYFGGSGKCAGCHGHDPAGVAFITSSGEDVNIADDWAGSMMANSARDPLWRAKVSHEILVNPAIQTDIENTCTRCHAPIGRFEAEYTGNMPYSMAAMHSDSLALDGVNCSACHQLKDTLMGNNFTGDLHFAKKHVFGPYTDPFSVVMEFFVGFQVSYSAHITKSELCGGCHTLITNSHDLAGNPTGRQFFEQTTYHEWKNSIYQAADSTCQDCHIPRINDSIDIATNYPFLDGRSPFGKHHLVGGNVFMLKLMKDNMNSIGATCEPKNFDTTIARTQRYLQNNTLDINFQLTNRTTDTAFYDVELTNKTGHKFPSGYPARISWVEFIVVDDNNDTIFWSGKYDGDGDVVNRDPVFEPHYNVINNGTQVQVYEMVMGDVVGNPTTVLERADTVLKDNRLVPKGFTTSHVSYDTIRIKGAAETDPDFNYSGPTEGTGKDIVHFHIPLAGYPGPLYARVNVWYHSVPRPWLQEMFAYNSPEIDSFRNFYNAADQTPTLVASAEIDDINTGNWSRPENQIRIYPNPTVDGLVRVQGWNEAGVNMVRLYDLSGKEVAPGMNRSSFNGTLLLPRKGVYLIVFETDKGKVTRKVLWH